MENTIRWREVNDTSGKTIPQSNSRFILWSDGSYTLHVGKEVFDVNLMKIKNQQNQLFVKQGELLKEKHIFDYKMTFRPSSISSDTHKNMSLSVADRVNRSQKIRLLAGLEKDPEIELMQKIKDEEIKEKEENRQETIKRRKSQSKLSRTSLSSSIFDAETEELEAKRDELKKKRAQSEKSLDGEENDQDSNSLIESDSQDKSSDEEEEGSDNEETASAEEEDLVSRKKKRLSVLKVFDDEEENSEK